MDGLLEPETVSEKEQVYMNLLCVFCFDWRNYTDFEENNLGNFECWGFGKGMSNKHVF